MIGFDSDNPVVPRVADGASGVVGVGVDSMDEVVVAAEVRGHHCHWSKDRMMMWAGDSRCRGYMMHHGWIMVILNAEKAHLANTNKAILLTESIQGVARSASRNCYCMRVPKKFYRLC